MTVYATSYMHNEATDRPHTVQAIHLQRDLLLKQLITTTN